MSTVSPYPSDGFSMLAAAGPGPTEVIIQPFTNSKEVVILNLEDVGGTDLLVQWGDPATATLTTANSTIVKPCTAITLAVGSEGDRNPAEPGGGVAKMSLLYAGNGGPVNVNTTYVNFRGINSAGGI
jgi:hypothetical protein